MESWTRIWQEHEQGKDQWQEPTQALAQTSVQARPPWAGVAGGAHPRHDAAPVSHHGMPWGAGRAEQVRLLSEVDVGKGSAGDCAGIATLHVSPFAEPTDRPAHSQQ